MVGDTDWILHLFGPAYDQLRSQLNERLNLANPSDVPYPHEPIESETILKIMCSHGIFARHGDLHDPWSCEGDRRLSSISDAIQLELVGPFVEELLEQNASSLSEEGEIQLSNLLHTRHIPSIVRGVKSLLPEMLSVDSERQLPYIQSFIHDTLSRCWNRHLERFLSLKSLHMRQSWHPIDIVAELRKTFQLVSGSGHSSEAAEQVWLSRGMQNRTAQAWIPLKYLPQMNKRDFHYHAFSHATQKIVLNVFDPVTSQQGGALRRAA